MFPSLSQCMCTVFVHFMVCLCACCRLHWSMFTSVRTQVVCENKCACLPWNSSCLGGGGERSWRWKSSAAPQSLRTDCSSLLAAMKSNQSSAFSPGLTSAFNYRTQQQQQHRERLPPLGHSQPVTTPAQGCGRDSRPQHTVAWHKHSVLKHAVGPGELSVLLHRPRLG